ncbi:PPE1 [Auxenochlorella protothecoides x Auxenochlorella symbiontica]
MASPLLRHVMEQAWASPAAAPEHAGEEDSSTSGVWSDYFQGQETVALRSRQLDMNVYSAGPPDAPMLLCLHGGGYTGLSWGVLAAELRGIQCQVVAPDLRGHGETRSPDDADLAAETLAADVAELWHVLAARRRLTTPLVLVGHSMGGAVAVWAARRILEEDASCPLAGVAVIDVVEGTALAALPSMRSVLSARPARFASLKEALAWARATHATTNPSAARLSLPSQLRWEEAGAATETTRGAGVLPLPPSLPSISEDGGVGATGAEVQRPPGLPPRPPLGRPKAPDQASGGWVWRTPLPDSAPFWDGWYRGLSPAFLGLPCPKVLVLAGTDRLDKALTIGQMQGRFQLALLPQAGHAVHEDAPGAVAGILSGFLARHRVGLPGLAIPSRSPGTQHPAPSPG